MYEHHAQSGMCILSSYLQCTLTAAAGDLDSNSGVANAINTTLDACT